MKRLSVIGLLFVITALLFVGCVNTESIRDEAYSQGYKDCYDEAVSSGEANGDTYYYYEVDNMSASEILEKAVIRGDYFISGYPPYDEGEYWILTYSEIVDIMYYSYIKGLADCGIRDDPSIDILYDIDGGRLADFFNDMRDWEWEE